MLRFELVAVLVLLQIALGKVLNDGDSAIYRDCDELMDNGGYNKSGLYRVFMEKSKPFEVLCRYDIERGMLPYTTIMSQKFGLFSFRKNYAKYVSDFGMVSSGDFWSGLRYMKYLSDKGKSVLTITMVDWTYEKKIIKYRLFKLSGHRDHFRLKIGGYVSSSILPDDFSFNNNSQFAAPDVPDVHNCARKLLTGWWFNERSNDCTNFLPTGKHYNEGVYMPTGPLYDGVFYNDWKGKGYSLNEIKMELSRA